MVMAGVLPRAFVVVTGRFLADATSAFVILWKKESVPGGPNDWGSEVDHLYKAGKLCYKAGKL